MILCVYWLCLLNIFTTLNVITGKCEQIGSTQKAPGELLTHTQLNIKHHMQMCQFDVQGIFLSTSEDCNTKVLGKITSFYCTVMCHPVTDTHIVLSKINKSPHCTCKNVFVCQEWYVQFIVVSFLHFLEIVLSPVTVANFDYDRNNFIPPITWSLFQILLVKC